MNAKLRESYGIPLEAMPMGKKNMGYADNSTVCDSRGNCMVGD
jgi:hypothetical protein